MEEPYSTNRRRFQLRTRLPSLCIQPDRNTLSALHTRASRQHPRGASVRHTSGRRAQRVARLRSAHGSCQYRRALIGAQPQTFSLSLASATGTRHVPVARVLVRSSAWGSREETVPDGDLVCPPLRCSIISSSSALLSRWADAFTAPATAGVSPTRPRRPREGRRDGIKRNSTHMQRAACALRKPRFPSEEAVHACSQAPSQQRLTERRCKYGRRSPEQTGVVRTLRRGCDTELKTARPGGTAAASRARRERLRQRITMFCCSSSFCARVCALICTRVHAQTSQVSCQRAGEWRVMHGCACSLLSRLLLLLLLLRTWVRIWRTRSWSCSKSCARRTRTPAHTARTRQVSLTGQRAFGRRALCERTFGFLGSRPANCDGTADAAPPAVAPAAATARGAPPAAAAAPASPADLAGAAP
jgi:hypothetical protein